MHWNGGAFELFFTEADFSARFSFVKHHSHVRVVSKKLLFLSLKSLIRLSMRHGK
jgi:hypothetical protein